MGGDHFSKSYISAVERDKIIPSYEALHFFAEQLGQQKDYFETLFLQNETEKSSSALTDTQFYHNEQVVQEKILPLLDILLEGSEVNVLPYLSDFSLLAPDVTAHFSSDIQGRYAFLLGLIAQQKEDFPTALRLLEQAAPLAPRKYLPAILDALGSNYYYAQSYYVALDYHERALACLEELENADLEKDELVTVALRLKMEFHCGNDYHALGAHQLAREHFEQARLHLRSAQDIKTAAQLYLRLGYCTYADVYHRTALIYTTDAAMDDIEREFQRAISYFVQSRTLYQVGSDRFGEARARISQAMVLLDLSTRRRQVAQERAKTTDILPPINVASLLDEAEEQCRQVLLGWEADATYPVAELEILLYTALAYLIRIAAQRATIAHLNEYNDTAERERSVAYYLGQQVVDTLAKQDFPWTLIHTVATLKQGTILSRTQTIPRIPEQVLCSNVSLRQDMSRSVVLFALGEVTEALGHAANQIEFAETCYERANQNFAAALDAYRLVVPAQERDMSFLYRVYQRCIDVLEERKQIRPIMEEKTNLAILRLLKDALHVSYSPVL